MKRGLIGVASVFGLVALLVAGALLLGALGHFVGVWIFGALAVIGLVMLGWISGTP